MKNKKKITIITLASLAGLLLIVAVGFFIFREQLLDQAIAKTTLHLDQNYDSKLKISKAEFTDFNGIRLTQISLKPNAADTLFNIQKMETSINFWRLFTGDIQLGTLKINNGYVQLTKKGTLKNFAAFLKKDSTAVTTNDKRDYADFAYRIITTALNLVPTDMKIENLKFKLDDNGKKATINIQKLVLNNSKLETAINVQTNTFTQRWNIKGYADPRNKKADLRFFNRDTGAIKVPYFDERYNLISSFDSIRLNIKNIDKTGGQLHIDGFTSIVNLKINHPKIASKDVLIKK